MVEANRACDAQIGVPKMAGLSEAELRERFEARDAQYSCLDELGYENHPRLTYDEFVDEYERSGQTYLWEPAAVIGGPGDANVDCPRTDVW